MENSSHVLLLGLVSPVAGTCREGLGTPNHAGSTLPRRGHGVSWQGMGRDAGAGITEDSRIWASPRPSLVCQQPVNPR